MFHSCDLGKLKKITGLNTSKCSKFAYMFYGADLTNLEPLTLDTGSGTSFSNMFQATIFPNTDNSIINISDFDTSNATNFYYMFNNADYIPTKDFSK
jgi:hypothetical protein